MQKAPKVQAELDKWKGRCQLNRYPESLKLTNYIDSVQKELLSKKLERGHILNLDAGWGEGKTTFIRLWEEDLRPNYITVYFDAWKNDYYDDPLVPFFASLDSKLELFNSTKSSRIQLNSIFNLRKAATIAVAILAKQALGVGINQLLSSDDAGEDRENSSIDGHSISNKVFSAGKEIIDSAKEGLNQNEAVISELKALVKEVKSNKDLQLPIYIFVDELDRCKPIFAVALLERIKHFFDVPGIQFIVATNTKELCHTVSSVYGQGFNSLLYLKRFFDDQYSFPIADSLLHAKSLFNEDVTNIIQHLVLPQDKAGRNVDFAAELYSDMCVFFSWSMRDRLGVFQTLKHIAFMQNKGDKIHLVPILFYLGCFRILDAGNRKFIERNNLFFILRKLKTDFKFSHNSTTKKYSETIGQGQSASQEDVNVEFYLEGYLSILNDYSGITEEYFPKHMFLKQLLDLENRNGDQCNIKPLPPSWSHYPRIISSLGEFHLLQPKI